MCFLFIKKFLEQNPLGVRSNLCVAYAGPWPRPWQKEGGRGFNQAHLWAEKRGKI